MEGTILELLSFNAAVRLACCYQYEEQKFKNSHTVFIILKYSECKPQLLGCAISFPSPKEEPMDTDQGNSMLSAIQSEVAKNQMLIEEEVQKLKRYKVCF